MRNAFWCEAERTIVVKSRATSARSVRKTGAPVGLMSDNAKSELHGKMKDILHMCKIDDHQLEPHCQHQNPVEHKIQNAKCAMNSAMGQMGCPKKWWLACTSFVVVLFNHLPGLHGEIPLTEITAQIQDISKFMNFDKCRPGTEARGQIAFGVPKGSELGHEGKNLPKGPILSPRAPQIQLHF